MLRIAVCDDNTEFTQLVKRMIDRWPGRPATVLCSCFDNGDELTQAHSSMPFDIILLDIVMPVQNGIDIARHIRTNDKTVKIVFLTSSPEFAVESYTVKANNYLMKPVNAEKLYRCLDEFAAQMAESAPAINIKGLHAVQKVFLENIEYVEAQNKHIIFALTDGTTIKTTQPLHMHESSLTLADGFFKCHRSYIVNIHHIDKYSLKEITMHSGCLIPVSRSVCRDFEAAYFEVTFGKAGERL